MASRVTSRPRLRGHAEPFPCRTERPGRATRPLCRGRKGSGGGRSDHDRREHRRSRNPRSASPPAEASRGAPKDDGSANRCALSRGELERAVRAERRGPRSDPWRVPTAVRRTEVDLPEGVAVGISARRAPVQRSSRGASSSTCTALPGFRASPSPRSISPRSSGYTVLSPTRGSFLASGPAGSPVHRVDFDPSEHGCPARLSRTLSNAFPAHPRVARPV